MGKIIKTDDYFEYQQENGDATAWFSNLEEKMELEHEGSAFYKKLFYFMISIGILYLLIVFLFVR